MLSACATVCVRACVRACPFDRVWLCAHKLTLVIKQVCQTPVRYAQLH